MFVYPKDEVVTVDRGNKQWEGHWVMLPEHRDLWFDRRQKKKEYRPPELVEDEIEKNQPPYFLVQGARAAITLIYAERYSPKRITGVVVRLDPIKRWLILQSEEDRKTIPLAQIIGAEEESKRHPVGGLFFRTFMTSSTRFSVQSSR